MTRLNSLILLSGVELPLRATYDMISSAINIVVQIARFSDGSRRITAVTEMTGRVVDNMPEMNNIFLFKQKSVDAEGRVHGAYVATGHIPACYEEFIRRGIVMSKDIFSPEKVYEV